MVGGAGPAGWANNDMGNFYFYNEADREALNF
jgi:hypothetical protein